MPMRAVVLKLLHVERMKLWIQPGDGVMPLVNGD